MKVCGFCVGKLTVIGLKGLGSIIFFCKDQFFVAIDNYFAKDDIPVKNIEKKCIVISLGVRRARQLDDLLRKIENRKLHRDICSLIEEIDFGGFQITLPPEHLSVHLETADGEPIDRSNFLLIFAAGKSEGMTFSILHSKEV